MTESHDADGINWSLTTFAGARREQLRRWSQLPLRDILLAQEEMQRLVNLFHGYRRQPTTPAITESGHEHISDQNHS